MPNTFTYQSFERKQGLLLGLLVLFGLLVSFNSNAQTYVPFEVNSSVFNEDVIAENLPAIDNTTTSVDNPNEIDANYVIPIKSVVQSQYPNSEAGLPNDGIIHSQATPGLYFSLRDFDENNVIRYKEFEQETVLMTVQNPTFIEKLYVLATSGQGQSKFEITFYFDDGTSQSKERYVPDWNDNPNMWFQEIAYQGIGRVKNNSSLFGDFNGVNPPHFNLFQIEVELDEIHIDSNKIIESIRIQKVSSGGYLNVFGFAAEIDCVDPITVSADPAGLCPGGTVTLTATTESEEDEIWFQGDNPEGEEKDPELGSAIAEVDEPGTYYFRAYNPDKDCWGPAVAINVYDIPGPENLEITAPDKLCIGNGDLILEASADAPVLENTIYEAFDYEHFQEWTASYNNSVYYEWDLNNTDFSPLNTDPPKIRYDASNYFDWNEDSENYIRSPLIDSSFYSDIEVEFYHYVDDETGSIWSYEVVLEISINGINWLPIYSEEPINDIGPQLKNIELNDFGDYDYEQFYIRFGVLGDDYSINSWDIDNIKVTGTPMASDLTYTWEAPNGIIYEDHGDELTISNPSPENSGEYTVTVTFGDCSISETVEVLVKQCEAYINPQIRQKTINQ